MFRRPVKEINSEFVAEEKYLDSIQRIVKEACAAAGMSRRDQSAVLLAVEEGATNIIRHAYLYEKGTLRLRIVIYRKFITFSLIDTGRSFHPEESGKIDLDRLVESGRKGGLGFYMIRKIMDSVEYISAAGSNELRMTKRIRPTAASATPPLLRRMFTLRVKFSLFTFIIVSIIIGAAYYAVDYNTRLEVRGHLENIMQALGTTIADQAAGYFLNSRSDVEFDELVVSYVRSNPGLEEAVITDNSGIIRAHSEDIANIRKPFVSPPGVDPTAVGVHQVFDTPRGPRIYLPLRIVAGEQVLGRVYLVYSFSPIDAKVAQLRQKILFLTLILLAIGIVGIYLLSNYFVKPIGRITERVRRFTTGDLESELPLEGADEFFEIARALNDMMTRLSKDRRNIIEREKMQKEIEVASQIQKTLLPRELPAIPGLELDAYYRAASVVGGDLYDVFEIAEDRYCLTVADVSGKGVPASLVMSMLRTVIQIEAGGALSAKETLLMVNNYLHDNMPPGMFITVLMLIYDARTRSINLVSAGHNPLLYYKAGTGQLLKINPQGMPLGVPSTLERDFKDGLEEISLDLEVGDVFFIYTDGITEATDRDGRQYGLNRLIEYLRTQFARDDRAALAPLSEEIVHEIDNFAGFAKQNDDITFILARVTDTTTDRHPSAPGEQQDQSIDSRSISATHHSPADSEPGQ